MEQKKSQEKKKKGFVVYLPLILVVLAVLVGGGIWYRNYTKYISTDDAYVDGDKVAVSSKILGRISKIYVGEGDTVLKGTLLAELDSTELTAMKNSALAQKNQAVASKTQTEAKYEYDQESIKVYEINYTKAKDDLARAKSQYEGGVLTQEQYEHTQKAYEAAKVQYEAAQSQLKVSRAQVASSKTSIESTAAQVSVTDAQLRNTRLYSPVNGVIAKRWLLPGDISQPGQSIFTVISDSALWITVYIEETKVSDIHIGQKAEFKIDAIPGVTFTGKVFSVGSNTASLFSLIPPSNASGNFTKVTQRVPLKISVEGNSANSKEVSRKLLSGMSAVVKIYRD